MARALTSCNTLDQSPTLAEHMLHLNDGYIYDSFAEFDQDAERSSGPPAYEEDFRLQFAGTGSACGFEEKSYPAESRALLSGTSAAVAGEILNSVSYPVSQQLLITDYDLNLSGLPDDFGFPGFNEFADFWEGTRLCSQDQMATAVLPPQTNGWIEASSSCTRSGAVMSTTVSTELERPVEQRSYVLPACANASAGEGNDPVLQRQGSHSPQPVATGTKLRGLNSQVMYHGPSRTFESDAILPISLSSQREIPKKTRFLSFQPCISRKSTLHSQSQTLAKDRIQDSAVIVGDTVDDSNISRTTQDNFLQQELRKSKSKPPHFNGGCQPGERGMREYHDNTSENLYHMKLQQEPLLKSAPRRKYKRKQIPPGINFEQNEAGCVPTQLGHVERERQRRDVMNSKIAALELLLPDSSKRDRVSVVYGAIQLVKTLERDVKNHQQRFNEMKLRKAGVKSSRDPRRFTISNSIDSNKETRGSYFSNATVFNSMGTYTKPVATCTYPARGANGKSKRTHLSTGTLCLGGSSAPDERNVSVEFHVHIDNTVTAQEESTLKCRCRMDYLSKVIAVVDEFQLDLTSCNIIKLSSYFMCIMRLKARTRADVTNAQFAVQLRSVVEVDIASEAKQQFSGCQNLGKHPDKLGIASNGSVH